VNVELLTPDRLEASDLVAWRQMQHASGLDNPFLSPEFTLAVAGSKAGVHIARIEAEDGPAGYFPFERHRGGIGHPVGAGLSDCQGVVHAPGLHWSGAALLEACGLAVIEFDHLVANQSGFGATVTRTDPSPTVDLHAGWDGYIQARRSASRSFRRLMARWDALYEDHREVRFEYHTADPQVLNTLFAWKSSQYRRTGRVDRFAKPWIRDLVGTLMRSSSEHFQGVLACLWVDGQPIAVQAALATSAVMSLWFPAYSLEFARYSPGNILRLELIRAASEQGIGCIDMGKGLSVHKEHLKTSEIRVAEARVERSCARAWIHRAYREPPRRIERFVLDHPRLRVAARHTLARIGQARVGAHGG
jgi:CelD/BcsL family acetyltransferase involved in cellulose biosynthesis